MKLWQCLIGFGCVALFVGVTACAHKGAESFTPFEEWKSDVLAGNAQALQDLYSINPPARLVLQSDLEPRSNEVQYWAGLKDSGVTNFNPKILSLERNGNQAKLILRIEAEKDGQRIASSLAQVWLKESGGWRIADSQRTNFIVAAQRSLPEPAKPNAALYPDPSESRAELKTALTQAARENKRVLVVFGANWCYDCHVLDATFRSNAFAPLVQANYVVLHINIGDDGKDNNDLASQLGVNVEKGIPSLAVLDPDGKVVVGQQNGEFESTVKIGPEDVRAFLEKWKPVRG